MRAQYTAGDVDVFGWVDVPQAAERCRIAVPAGNDPQLVIVDDDGRLMIRDLGAAEDELREPREGEILVDFYGNPDDRPDA